MCRSTEKLVYHTGCLHVYCARHAAVVKSSGAHPASCVVCKTPLHGAAFVALPSYPSDKLKPHEFEFLLLTLSHGQILDNVNTALAFYLKQSEAQTLREHAELKTLHGKAHKMQSHYQQQVKDLYAQVKSLKARPFLR